MKNVRDCLKKTIRNREQMFQKIEGWLYAPFDWLERLDYWKPALVLFLAMFVFFMCLSPSKWYIWLPVSVVMGLIGPYALMSFVLASVFLWVWFPLWILFHLDKIANFLKTVTLWTVLKLLAFASLLSLLGSLAGY